MEERDESLIRQHADHDQELKALYEEHLDLKHQLESYRSKPYLTSDEEMEMKRIQKLKLASKDKLMVHLSRHRDEEAA